MQPSDIAYVLASSVSQRLKFLQNSLNVFFPDWWVSAKASEFSTNVVQSSCLRFTTSCSFRFTSRVLATYGIPISFLAKTVCALGCC